MMPSFLEYAGMTFILLLGAGAIGFLCWLWDWLSNLRKLVKDLRSDLDNLRCTSIGNHEFTNELNRRDNILKEMITGKIAGK